MKKERKMGIIRDAGYGCTYRGVPVLHFTVCVRESYLSSQILSDKKADEFIRAYNVWDVHNLNGKPVWLKDDGITMTDLEPCII